MMMLRSKTQVLHQQAKRILASSNNSCLFSRSYNTRPSHHVKADLEQLAKQGNQVMPSYVRGLIKNLNDTKHSSQALEASDWLCSQKVFNVFPEDYAARLHLVETVLGLEEAEKFFKSIPENMRDYNVYNTLLGYYTRSKKTLGKAESTFEKMRDLGFLLKPSPYNLMTSLYQQLKKQDMVEKLQREMEENVTTHVDEKRKEPEKDWNDFWTRVLPFLDWDVYKTIGKVKDDECRSVISSLLKVDNVEKAEKIYREWLPYGPKLDMSIPNLLISRFGAERNGSKVEEIVKSVKKKRIVMQIKLALSFLLLLVGGIVVVGTVGLTLAAIIGVFFAIMATLWTGVEWFMDTIELCAEFNMKHPILPISAILLLFCWLFFSML